MRKRAFQHMDVYEVLSEALQGCWYRSSIVDPAMVFEPRNPLTVRADVVSINLRKRGLAVSIGY